MNKNFSDEQLDQIWRKAVKDSLMNEDEIAEIADSPMLWRNVQRNITEAKSSRQKGWIPTWFDWRIAAFASAVLVVFCGLIWFANLRGSDVLAEVKAVEILVPETPKIDEAEIAKDAQTNDNEQFTPTKSLPKTSPKKVVSSKNNPNLTVSTKPANRSVHQAKNQPKTEEIKTDFIAFNYSPAAESGQIMKVKVPRSMMVSLGVTMKVENGAELVNAEILVGDDGLARAIRFIQ